MSLVRKKYMYPSIRLALVIAIAFSVLPAFILIVWTSLDHSQYIAENDLEDAVRQVEAFAEIQRQMTESTRNLFMALTSLPGFRSGNSQHVQEMLAALLPGNPNYLNLSLTDTKGLVTASPGLPEGTDLSDRYHVQVVLRDERFTVGEYILNKINASPSIPFSYPVFNLSGRLSGVFTGTIGLSTYSRLFDTMKLPENAILGLLDRKGQRLFFYPPKPTNPLGGRIQESVWKGILSGEDSGVLIDRGSDAVSRFYTYKKLRLSKTEEPYMYVVYAIPTALLYGPSRTVLLRNLLIMAAAAFFILLVALYSSNRLFGRRLERIVSTVNSINSGNLSARLNFSDDVSDLGRIAHALDRMTETIQRRNIEQVASAHVLMENLAEKELLLKEVHHRVKNNLQLILSFFTLQEGSAEGPEGLKIAMENRIRAMSMVHEKLQKSTDLQEIDLGDYTRQLAQLIVSSIDRSLIVPVDAGRVLSTLEKAIPYGLMLTELLSNVAKHAFNDAKEGTLFISLQSINNDVVLLVHDDGETLPSDFPNSKSAELALSIIRALVSQLHGKITWESGQGTSFTVVFPLV